MNDHDANTKTPEDRTVALADAAVAAGEYGEVPEGYMTYGEFLEMTGFDDSFVGDGVTVPGTGDVYEAMMRAAENRRIEILIREKRA